MFKMESMYDESIKICDDDLLEEPQSAVASKETNESAIHRNSHINASFVTSSEESEDSSESELSSLAELFQSDMTDEGPNGQIFQQNSERPVSRVGSRQMSSGQQQPSTSTGRPGTAGRNVPATSRQRPPSPEPSDDDDEDEEYEDDLNDSHLEGSIQKIYRKLTARTPSSSETEDGSLDENLCNLLKMADHTDMTCNEFTEMLKMFPDQSGFIPEQDGLSIDDQETQDVFVKKRWTELVLDQKREMLRLEARISANPGIHGIKDKGMYKPEDYANLNTTSDIKELFGYITKYLPAANMAPEVKFKPFIREYEASVGDIDAFIKVLHPAITSDGLGIKVLDEPSAFQSDPSVLDLRLRALAKQSSAKAVTVKRVENAHKNPKIIDNWIKDISDLHRSKPSPSVHYSKPMPDIDQLLQEWPPEFEELLKSVATPDSTLDCDLKTYVDLVCNVLDIPVYKSRIQSLHVLATLYLTQKELSAYGQFGGNSRNESQKPRTPNMYDRGGGGDNVDRMEI